MVTAIMHRIPSLDKPGPGGSGLPREEDNCGVRVIAGDNTGAVLQPQMDHEKSGHSLHGPVEAGDKEDGGPISTYMNSNFQLISNSIMMGGSHKVHNPGVRMEISDFVEHGTGHSKHYGQQKR
ncbi:uncharacterized protein LOC116204128 [Punica granatum]|uniref:Uncharacterized protein n=2 Tax=Punica granatum TaxID=22663 RepID=A0A218VYB2_PUNGR|nr:uncharacterized protein LOC116204128 [Punica granatum]OWM65070.1 hypothetical protein CDL15_Pgr028788 [Punica granatum]PKI76546.1 hypothetical protein CRG98_003097 [Punica granatum]